MEIKKITYFLRIVEEGSLSKAAASLYLTQPTLSRFLTNLEEELGTKLFTRERDNSLKLTAEGELYLDAARKIDTIKTQLESQLLCRNNEVNNIIRLGVDSDGILVFAKTCANLVNQKYPDARVEILRKNSNEIYRMVKDGVLTMGVSAFEEKNDCVSCIPVRNCKVDMIVGRQNPLAQRSYQLQGQETFRVDISGLDPQTPFVLLRDGTIFRSLEDKLLSQLSYTPRIACSSLRQSTINEMVAESRELVGFCPRDHFRPDLAYLALQTECFYMKGIIYRSDMKMSPVKRYLIQLLKDIPETLDIYS